ncbi:MAG: M15 family metallopeptidase [Akkermansia sp.]
MKTDIKLIQAAVGVTADGIIGPLTIAAIKDKLGIETVTECNSLPTKAEIRSNKSIYGIAGKVPLKKITPPYQLYYEGKPLTTISVHEAIADKVLRILQRTLDYYGAARIQELKLDQYSGCFSDRNTTNGTSKSMHAWGIALDFCAELNGYNTKTKDALFSRDVYKPFIQFWYDEGGRSFGLENGYDWMHFELCQA